MNVIRCVVFDFDGTLVDSNRLKRDAWFRVFGSIGCPPDAVERLLAAHPLADRTELIGRMLADPAVIARLGDRPDPAQATKLAAAYNDICETGQVTCAEMPGAPELLKELAGSFSLYVNSATPEEPLRRIIERRGWTEFFRGVYGRPRSKEENLALIASREGIPIRGIAMVGDGEADREAARTCGCQFFAVGDLPPGDYGRKLSGLAPLASVLCPSNSL
jgi:phosphoglycolate phosphatase